MVVKGDTITTVVAPEHYDPYIGVELTSPLKLEYGLAEWMLMVDEHFVPVFLLLLFSGWLLSVAAKRFSLRVANYDLWASRHPVITVAVLASHWLRSSGGVFG